MGMRYPGECLLRCSLCQFRKVFGHVMSSWSQDAHRFAAIRSTGDGTDALIYAIP
jgi:hypothetical protein